MKIKITNLDRLFSQYIRRKAGYACEKCGRRDSKLECAHVYSRRYKATRWEPDNAMCLCFTCHRYYTEHPHQWTEYTENKLGKRLDELWKMAQKAPAPKDHDKVEIGLELIDKIKAFGETPVCGLGRKLTEVKKRLDKLNNN